MFYSEKAVGEEPGVIKWCPGEDRSYVPVLCIDDCESCWVPESCSSVVRAKAIKARALEALLRKLNF